MHGFKRKHWRQYLLGRKFQLITDHKLLVTIFHSQKGLFTEMGHYPLKYQPSVQHGNADGLSHLPLQEVQYAKMMKQKLFVLWKNNSVRLFLFMRLTLRQLQLET